MQTIYRLVSRDGYLFLQFKTTRTVRKFLRTSTKVVDAWAYVRREANTPLAYNNDKVEPEAYISSTVDHSNELRTFMKNYSDIADYHYECAERFREWLEQVEGKGGVKQWQDKQ